MAKPEFDSFFKSYSQNVDQADNQYFWKLSDDVIESVIRQNLPPRLTKDQTVLDAGGGTGRWIVKLSSVYPSKFILYDLSTDMLAKAKKNLDSAGLSDRTRIVQGNLEDMSAIGDSTVDHIVSIYNPLSFVETPDKAIKEFHRILKPGGRLLVMGQGFYNSLTSKVSTYVAPPDELMNMDRDQVVKWNPSVPSLHTFSQESMTKLLSDNGFGIVNCYGIPVFLQPGPEDFDSTNVAKSSVSQALENDPFFYKTVMELELKYNNSPNLVDKGMNILAVGIKSSV